MVKQVNIRKEVRHEAKIYLDLLLSKNGFVFYEKRIQSSIQMNSFLKFSFPSLLCSLVVLETMINILNLLTFSFDDENFYKVIRYHRLANTNYSIQFAETDEKRLVSIDSNRCWN